MKGGEEELDYQQFEEIILERLQQKYPGYEIFIHDVTKNNGITLRGLSIREPDNAIAPTIYLEEMRRSFENGRDIDDIISEISSIYERHKSPLSADDIIINIRDWGSVCKRIYYTVINKERNNALLSEVPHRELLDLAVVYRISISMGNDIAGSVLIRNEMMQYWNAGEGELYQISSDNTARILGYELKNMWDILSEINGKTNEFKNFPPYMYVASNREKCNGAGLVFLDRIFRAGIMNHVGEEFIIIPSSVHETIVIPYSSDIDRDTVQDMVRQVNRTEVQNTEILSDNVYICKNDEIQIWN